jgi:hypothetical protein
MASTPERKVKQAVTARLKAYEAYYFYPVTGGYGTSGVPDIVACINGAFLAIECKAGRNTPTALQRRNLDAIMQAGGVALVVNEDNLDELDRVLDALRARAKG